MLLPNKFKKALLPFTGSKAFKKRSFLLLEVLIAFAIIAMCMLPLIAPHTFILREQKKFIEQVELDHLVNLVYADIIERLYRNEIGWGSLTSGTAFDVDEFLLERIQYKEKLPYKGTYSFNEIIHKPRDDSPRKIYLFELNMRFVPEKSSSFIPGMEKPGAIDYVYNVMVIRDLSRSVSPSIQTAPSNNPEIPQAGSER